MGMANPSNMYCESFLAETKADESLVFVPNPSYSGEKHYYIRTIDSIGINSICKNKETAYNFIKVLLSDEIQNGVNDTGYAVAGTDAPVNKKGYKISFDNWLHASLNKLPKETLYFVDNNADKFENPEIDDTAINNIIDESIQSYIEGKKSLDEAIKQINDKVSIFLNE
jgi:multiple sugar transport system substrate-binding protein